MDEETRQVTPPDQNVTDPPPAENAPVALQLMVDENEPKVPPPDPAQAPPPGRNAAASSPAQFVVVPPPTFDRYPMRVTCGNCHKRVLTQTTAKNGTYALIAALIVCLLFCPCFWIPLCMHSCKDIHHTCPSCGAKLGEFKR